MLQEIKHALQRHLRTPGQLAVITLILGLGIGTTTTIWSVVNGVLLRPLPFPRQEQLLVLWQRAPGVEVEEDWFSAAQYFDIRERATCFDETAILSGRNATLTGNGFDAERLGVLDVSASFFNLMGIQPMLGRVLTAEDDIPGSGLKTLLSRRLYERRFGGDPAILGRTIEVDGRDVEVVGVLPHLPLDSDLLPTLATVSLFDLVRSFPVRDTQKTTPGSENYNIMARMAPDATPQEVEATLLTIAEDFVQDPGSLGAGLQAGPEYRIGVVPLLDEMAGEVRMPLLVLLGCTLLLLVIACANVANLLLTSASLRQREYGIRTALGAPRWRMVSQAMSESLLLALTGGLFGIGIAMLGVRALHWASPEDLPRLGDVSIDPTVLLFAASLCLGASLLCGLGPALKTSGTAPSEVMRKTSSRGATRSLWQGGASHLVILQVALSLVLASGAALTIRTYRQLKAVDPGFRSDGVLSFRLSLTGQRYRSREERLRFFELLHDRLRSLPGISEVGGVSLLPLTRNYAWTNFYIEGVDTGNDQRDRTVADVVTATAGYYESMGVQLLAGRTFTRADDNEPSVVLVNRTFASRFWSLDDATGKWIGRRRDAPSTIVGVIDDIRHYGLDQDVRPAVIYPYPRSANRTLYTTIRSSTSPDSVAPAVIAAIRAVDPRLPIYDVRSMLDRVGDSLARQRVLMTLLNLFSVIALLLAVVGLYGVLSFTVTTQTREIGIRRALGAQRGDLYLLVFRGAAVVTVLGIALGLAAALTAARSLEGLLWGVSTADPLSYGLATLVVGLVAVAASFLPARKAASIDPMIALRAD